MLTVAGEALLRFSTSNTNFVFSVIGIRSLFASVKILLSSSTVFRFSIQIASTGPSHVIQVWCLIGLLYLAQITDNTPSVHSLVVVFITPKISCPVNDFGFILTILWGVLFLVKASDKAFAIVVLPDPAGLTSINLFLTREVSYSWMIL